MDINLGNVKGQDGLGIMYPGFKYASRSNVSPAQLYGGTWELQDYHDFQGLYIWIKVSDEEVN